MNVIGLPVETVAGGAEELSAFISVRTYDARAK